jgi:hypothetical protein
VLGQHIVGVLAALWPRHALASIHPQATHQLLLEPSSGRIVVDGNDPFAHALNRISGAVQERELAVVVLRVDRGRTVRDRHAGGDARHLHRELVDLALDDHTPRRLDIVQAVQDSFGPRLHAEVFFLVAVLGVDEFFAAVVRETNRLHPLLDLRHVDRLRVHPVSTHHGGGNAPRCEPLNHRNVMRLGDHCRLGTHVHRPAPVLDLVAARARLQGSRPSAMLAEPDAFGDVHAQAFRVFFLARR